MTLHLPMTAVDDFGHKTYTKLSLALYYKREVFIRTRKHIVLQPVRLWHVFSDTQTLLEGQCTTVNVTFFKIGKGKNPLKPVLVTTTVANVSHWF